MQSASDRLFSVCRLLEARSASGASDRRQCATVAKWLRLGISASARQQAEQPPRLLANGQSVFLQPWQQRP
jgi:hypothetical protein